MPDDLWVTSRGGSHAGRGFHYQDAVATELAVRAWRGELPLRRLIPEGLEDVSLELDAHWLHLQAKSRREHRGEFSLAELRPAWRHLAGRLAEDAAAHAGLVLERPFAGAETGLGRVLADVASASLRREIAAAVDAVVDAEDFLARTHVLVIPASPVDAVALVAERLAVPPATCVAHYSILRAELVRLADENGARSAADPASLTVGDVGRILDEVSEAVDPAALEEAVRDGIAELVDFATPVEDERFYTGVDVVVGHIVAGLPLERRELVDQLSAGLKEQRVALAVGPSGAGKSALIWLTAFATRHRVRWHRIRRLRDDDVPALVRLVKSLRPTMSMPVGFVVDDLGRDDRAGFDRLVEELRGRPGTFVLGACRAEDLFVVRSAPAAAQVRPLLEHELAERIWHELQASGETAWPEWREPYEQSEGLLLEYGHLLTEGTRLDETIAAQVEQRVRERRALELDILALVATADAFGAEIDATRLTSAVGADDAGVRRALERLVDEHLIAERNGRVGGLHELRSRYVMARVHRLPPPTLAETVQRVIHLLESAALQPFLARLLLEEAIDDEVAVDAVAARLRREPDAEALAAALQALRLVGFRRMTTLWREIFVDEGAAPTNVSLVAHFALHGGDHDLFPEPIQHAVARIRQLEWADLRASLVEKIAAQLPLSFAAADVKTAAALLAALSELGVAVDAADLTGVADGAPLGDLRLLLEAAYAVAPELADALVGELGGAAALLARLERERPWARDAHLSVDASGRPTANAHYAYVAESVQPNAHDAVVELARYLFAFAPAAEVAVCRAVDARGQTAGFGGMALADKAIERRYLPNEAQIAWNRARTRAAVAAVASVTQTDYVRAAREIVVGAERLVRRAGDSWVRGRKPSKQLVDDAIALAEAANRLAPPPIVVDTIDVVDDNPVVNDPVSFVGKMIPNNLFLNLFKGNRVAPLIPQILEQVDELADPERWRLVGEPPLAKVATLRQALVDLHAVVAEGAAGDRMTAVVLRAAGKGGLASAAGVARERAANRMQTLADALERRIQEADFTSHVARRQSEPDSYRWPSDDFLVLVDVPTIYDWHRNLETLADLCRHTLKDRIGFLMAPVRDGRIVASFGVKVIDNVFPDESVRDWPEPPLPLLEERLGNTVRRGLTGLHEASGIIASVRRDEVHDDEVAVLEAAVAEARKALQHIADLAAGRDDQLLTEVGTTLLELSQQVEDEAAALGKGEPTDRSLAASLLVGFEGDGDDVFFAQVGMVAACVEWDVDRRGAWERVEKALEAIDSN